jgi:S-adenosylmethionine synthetase
MKHEPSIKIPMSVPASKGKAFSFKPADIIEAMGLKIPIFSATTNYGHIGKADLPWEKSDRKKLAKLKS